MKNFLHGIIFTLILVALSLLFIIFAGEKQVRKDCLKAQRHLQEYNIPIPSELNSLCIENGYYN